MKFQAVFIDHVFGVKASLYWEYLLEFKKVKNGNASLKELEKAVKWLFKLKISPPFFFSPFFVIIATLALFDVFFTIYPIGSIIS